MSCSWSYRDLDLCRATVLQPQPAATTTPSLSININIIMPLSHLTLTVSHLPTSTSFFLSCLQPLGYRFIGRHDNSVGFGAEPGEPADFWISEERPGYVLSSST